MMMPGLPGDMFYTAVERIKPHLCKRFIFMTGYKGETKIEEFIRRVHGVMLWKPFQMEEMMDTINSVVQVVSSKR
jgi:DNA-binding NarL/FixJ family response regulator